MNLCVNCKHYEPTYVESVGGVVFKDINHSPTHECGHPSRFIVSMVTGKTEGKTILCSIARKLEFDCGKEAKWFEEKPVKPVQPVKPVKPRKKWFGIF